MGLAALTVGREGGEASKKTSVLRDGTAEGRGKVAGAGAGAMLRKQKLFPIIRTKHVTQRAHTVLRQHVGRPVINERTFKKHKPPTHRIDPAQLTCQ